MQDSITKSINEWLLKIPLIKDNYDIKIEEVDGVKQLALQRSGVDIIKSYFKGRIEQYDYVLFLKENSEGNSNKIRNFDWIDDLVDEINTKVRNGDLPIHDTKQFTSCECANGISYEVSEDGLITNYQLQINFKITTF